MPSRLGGAALQSAHAQADGPDEGFYFINNEAHPTDGLLYSESKIHPQGERVLRDTHTAPGRLTAADRPFIFEVRKTEGGGYTIKSLASGLYVGRIPSILAGNGCGFVSSPTELKIYPVSDSPGEYCILNEDPALAQSGGYIQWQADYYGEKAVGYNGTSPDMSHFWIFDKVDAEAIAAIEDITEVEGSVDDGYYYITFPYGSEENLSLVPVYDDDTWRLDAYPRDEEFNASYVWHATRHDDGTYTLKNCGSQQLTYVRSMTRGPEESTLLDMTGTETSRFRIQMLSNGCAYLYLADNDNNLSLNFSTYAIEAKGGHSSFSIVGFTPVPAEDITNSLKLQEATTDAIGHYFSVGDDPGQVSQEDYDAFDAVLQRANAAAGSDDDHSALIEELREATEALLAKRVPLEEGYYTFRSVLYPDCYMYPHYNANQGWGDGEGWYLFTEQVNPANDAAAVWHLLRNADGNLTLKNCGAQDSTYVVSGSGGYTWGRMRMSGTRKATLSLVNDCGNRFSFHGSDNNLYWNADSPDNAVSGNNGYHPNGSLWYVERVEEEDIPYLSELREAITDARGAVRDSKVGPNPGDNLGDPAGVSAAVAEAEELYDGASATAGEIQAAIDKLKDETAKFNAQSHEMRGVEDGYYYIVNTHTDFEHKGRELAMYVPTSNELNWTAIAPADGRFLFSIADLGNGTFSVRNVQAGRYVGSYDGNSVKTTAEQETAQRFAYQGNGIWHMGNSANDGDYTLITVQNETSGSVGINPSYDFKSWRLVRATDQALVDSIVTTSAQAQANEAVNTALQKAEPAYKAVFKYDVDHSRGLIAEADNDNPRNGQIVATQEPAQAITSEKPNNYSSYTYLIDNNLGTGMQSTWDASVWDARLDAAGKPANPQWLQVDLRDNPVDNFEFYFALTNNVFGWRECWTDIDIYATNDDALAAADSTNLGQWTHIGRYNDLLSYLQPADAGENSTGRYFYYPVTGVDRQYRYLRFCVNSTIQPQANMMYCLAEFQVYNLAYNENSPYNYVDGLKSLADGLKAQIDSCKQSLANGTATMEEARSLAELTAKVAALTPNTTELDSKIAEVRSYISNFGDGDDWGDTPAGETDAINSAIDEADNYNHAQPVASDVAARLSALNEAYASYLAQQRKPQEGVWYRIVSTDKQRIGNSTENPTGGGSIWDSWTAGDMVMAQHSNNTRAARWIYNEDALYWGGFDHINSKRVEGADYDPYAMWRLVRTEGSGAANVYALQNRATGYFMGVSYNTSGGFGMSATPVPYEVNLLKSGEMEFVCADAANTSKYPIHASGDGKMVSWMVTGADSPSSWTLEPVDEEIDHLEVAISAGSVGILTLPYAYDDENVASQNEAAGIQTYGIKGLYDDGTSLALYRKDSFAAGEPMIVVAGEGVSKIHLPLAGEYSYEPQAANGLVGVFDYSAVPASAGIISGSSVRRAGSGVHINGQSGYIDGNGIVNDDARHTDLTLGASGIFNGIAAAAAAPGGNVDVYSADGVLLRKGVRPSEAKAGLRRGVYIIGKQKVLVR